MEYATTQTRAIPMPPASREQWIRDGHPNGASYRTLADGTVVRVFDAKPQRGREPEDLERLRQHHELFPTPATLTRPASVQLELDRNLERRHGAERRRLVEESGAALGRSWRGDPYAYARAEGYVVARLPAAELTRLFGPRTVGALKGASIYVSSAKSVEEQRLTVAHEMGHAVLGSACSSGRHDQEELAEAFARAFCGALNHG